MARSMVETMFHNYRNIPQGGSSLPSKKIYLDKKVPEEVFFAE